MKPKVRKSAVLRSLLCLLVWSAASISVVAQTVNVTIQGRVYDSTGAAIPQAAVSAVNAATGFSRSDNGHIHGRVPDRVTSCGRLHRYCRQAGLPEIG